MTTPEEKRFAKTLAQNAIVHPEWEFDEHFTQLRLDGFGVGMIHRNSRAISEAILYAQAMRFDRKI